MWQLKGKQIVVGLCPIHSGLMEFCYLKQQGMFESLSLRQIKQSNRNFSGVIPTRSIVLMSHVGMSQGKTFLLWRYLIKRPLDLDYSLVEQNVTSFREKA